MGAIRRWWRQPDQYDWLSSYLHARGFSRPTQIFMAVVSASGTLVPANALWGPTATNHVLLLGLGVVAGVAGLGYAVLWLTKWPTWSQSVGFALTICVSIALGSWTNADPAISLTACAALAVSGGYLAFFHSTRLVTANLAVALGIAAVHAVQLAGEGEPVLALSLYFLVVELNAGVPLAIQIVVHALGFDLIQSDRDPLTGLLNRRSFEREVVAAVLDDERHSRFLVFAMIDLDHFKALNDTLGHSAGDDALVAVGHALRSRLPQSAIVGRIGGEEFLVADLLSTPMPGDLGEGAREAVTHTPYDLTASVGTATVAISQIDAGNIVDTLHRLTAQADVAMYQAKRGGRNQVRHHAADLANGAYDPDRNAVD
ncbi:diguanylate cyclase (GGDEF)-like protein [Mycolicibacterium iranicum]|uniref:Diguanylate cyclase (GGDEF)-like protein n=1 Tax=Mycolicibacterium iranicum TaxID=912594 RepID=A0A839Q9X4_MYCIR|nr:GGDEF domain-containing protein [Mycolicibacterium iranicum]MBB2991255.1 diguanylate cyclase (GGDEF)-like protein [Mycolicibacterium iranicum]